MQLKEVFLYSGVREILEGKDYSAVDMRFPVGTDFVNRVTAHIKSPNLARVYAIYSLIISRVVSVIGNENALAEN